MYRQAITTKFLNPTNARGARVKASAFAGSVTVPWNHGLSADDNHKAAARALIQKFSWWGYWALGGSGDRTGLVFVWLGPDATLAPVALLVDLLDCRAPE